jgi:hypothetical protein
MGETCIHKDSEKILRHLLELTLAMALLSIEGVSKEYNVRGKNVWRWILSIGQRDTLAQVIDLYIVAFNGIPRIALAPLFIFGSASAVLQRSFSSSS